MTAIAGRRLLAEFTGTGLLVAVVVGSGIAVTRLTTDGALRLLVGLGTLLAVILYPVQPHRMAPNQPAKMAG